MDEEDAAGPQAETAVDGLDGADDHLVALVRWRRRCRSITPFGVPVLPEVYWIRARSSGPTSGQPRRLAPPGACPEVSTSSPSRPPPATRSSPTTATRAHRGDKYAAAHFAPMVMRRTLGRGDQRMSTTALSYSGG